jgi:hypothetical protein
MPILQLVAIDLFTRQLLNSLWAPL